MLVQLRVSPISLYTVLRNGMRITEVLGGLPNDASKEEKAYYKSTIKKRLVQGFGTLMLICYGILAYTKTLNFKVEVISGINGLFFGYVSLGLFV